LIGAIAGPQKVVHQRIEQGIPVAETANAGRYFASAGFAAGADR
jgi:hypothetical protein